MFSGIIQNLGEIINFSNGELELSTSLDLSDCKIGSSICCDGVCLTITYIILKNDNYFFKVNVGEETQSRTNYNESQIYKSKKINLEKSLKIGDEISGHFVYGHVDRTTQIKKIKELQNSWEFYFDNSIKQDYKFIVEKASIAINGISLTIAKVENNNFSISVIPHTYRNTNLKYLRESQTVNVEFDYLARFSQRSFIK